jgi:hypothetical protein
VPVGQQVRNVCAAMSFKLLTLACAPTGYAIRVPMANQHAPLRSWVFEASLTGAVWTVLDMHLNDPILAEPGGIYVFPLPSHLVPSCTGEATSLKRLNSQSLTLSGASSTARLSSPSASPAATSSSSRGARPGWFQLFRIRHLGVSNSVHDDSLAPLAVAGFEVFGTVGPAYTGDAVEVTIPGATSPDASPAALAATSTGVSAAVHADAGTGTGTGAGAGTLIDVQPNARVDDSSQWKRITHVASLLPWQWDTKAAASTVSGLTFLDDWNATVQLHGVDSMAMRHRPAAPVGYMVRTVQPLVLDNSSHNVTCTSVSASASTAAAATAAAATTSADVTSESVDQCYFEVVVEALCGAPLGVGVVAASISTTVVSDTSDESVDEILTKAMQKAVLGDTGCDRYCQKSHNGDGACLLCGHGWGRHHGHTCYDDGRRGSWVSFKPIAGGCGDACNANHANDGNCLRCGLNWGHHSGHKCRATGARGSWDKKQTNTINGPARRVGASAAAASAATGAGAGITKLSHTTTTTTTTVKTVTLCQYWYNSNGTVTHGRPPRQSNGHDFAMHESDAPASLVTVPYGEPFVVGDMIGCLVHHTSQEVEFFLNGRSQGIAFTLPPVEEHAQDQVDDGADASTTTTKTISVASVPRPSQPNTTSVDNSLLAPPKFQFIPGSTYQANGASFAARTSSQEYPFKLTIRVGANNAVTGLMDWNNTAIGKISVDGLWDAATRELTWSSAYYESMYSYTVTLTHPENQGSSALVTSFRIFES